MFNKGLVLAGLLLVLQPAVLAFQPTGLVLKDIISDKRNETVYVVPGTVFCTYRNFSGKDLTVSPLYSEDLELVSIDVVSSRVVYQVRDVPVSGVCVDTYNSSTGDSKESCGSKDACSFVNESCVCESSYTYLCLKGTEKVSVPVETVSYTDIKEGSFDRSAMSDKEKEVYAVKQLLPASVKALPSAGVSEADAGGVVRFCFRAPSFEEIRSGQKKASGKVSYMAYDSDGYDVCTSSWWDSGWGKRVQVSIGGQKENLVNYPVEVLVNATKLYEAGLLRSDCLDLAFANDSTAFNHWVRNCTTNDGSALTSVWVNVSGLAGNESRTDIYMYYNNSAYTGNMSNGSNVFSFYDDFGDGVIGPMWSVSGSVVEGGGYVSTADGSSTPFISLNMGSRGLNYSTQFKASFRMYNAEDDTGGERCGWALSSSASSAGDNAMRGGNYQLYYANDANNQAFDGYTAFNQAEWLGYMNRTAGAWLEASITRNLSGQVVWQVNDETRVRNTPSGWTGGYFTFGQWDTDQTTDACWLDDLIIRKYASPEPLASLGSEETPCSIGVGCESCTGWTYINLTVGGSLQVKDTDGNGKYDIVCCSGIVSNFGIL